MLFMSVVLRVEQAPPEDVQLKMLTATAVYKPGGGPSAASTQIIAAGEELTLECSSDGFPCKFHPRPPPYTQTHTNPPHPSYSIWSASLHYTYSIWWCYMMWHEIVHKDVLPWASQMTSFASYPPRSKLSQNCSAAILCIQVINCCGADCLFKIDV